jgi:hypothetical protein
MQMQIHRVLADRAQRPIGQAHFATRNLEVLAVQRLGNIRGADGAEQLALARTVSLKSLSAS